MVGRAVVANLQKICEILERRERHGKHFTIVVVAEGVNLPAEMKHITRTAAVANMIGDAIALLSHKEVRVSVLGHIQRGGSPSPYDRILATRFGVAAVDLISAGEFGKMVCLQQESIRAVTMADAVGKMRLLIRTVRSRMRLGQSGSASETDEAVDDLS